MIRLAAVLAGPVLAAALMAVPDRASARNFECETEEGFRVPTKHQDDVEAWLRNNYPRQSHIAASWYVELWDAEEMRRRCQAVANGGAPSSTISCLSGERDWNEISELTPDELVGGDLNDIGRLQVEAGQKARQAERAANRYCMSVGVTR